MIHILNKDITLPVWLVTIKKKENTKKTPTQPFLIIYLWCVLLEQFPEHEQITGVKVVFIQFPLEILQCLNCTICLFAKVYVS